MIEQLVKKHGEKYRRLIEDSLHWLDTHEEHWDLTEPLNREQFIEELVNRAKTPGSSGTNLAQSSQDKTA